MKILIDILQKTKKNLLSLELIMNQEYKFLSSSNSNLDKLNSIIKQKEYILKNFLQLSQERTFFEKKYNIFIPYENYSALKKYWNFILNKSLLLKKINTQNKVLLDKKFYFNQYFLELFLSRQQCITYNMNGKLKF